MTIKKESEETDDAHAIHAKTKLRQNPNEQVLILYINYRGGSMNWCAVHPKRITFGETAYHSLQWLLYAWDARKEACRLFAMRNIMEWIPLPRLRLTEKQLVLLKLCGSVGDGSHSAGSLAVLAKLPKEKLEEIIEPLVGQGVLKRSTTHSSEDRITFSGDYGDIAHVAFEREYHDIIEDGEPANK